MEHRPDARRERPIVTLSYAQSLDGCIAPATRRPLALSCPESLQMTHALRAEHDAVLVGIGTVIADDPQLTVRFSDGRSPQPIVVDSRLRFPLDARLLGNGARLPWVVTTDRADASRRTVLQRLGVQVLDAAANGEDRVDLAGLLTLLDGRGIRRLMVEGGSQIISAFLAAHLVDHLVLTIAPKFVCGLHAPAFLGDRPPALRDVEYQPAGSDLIVRARLDWSGG